MRLVEEASDFSYLYSYLAVSLILMWSLSDAFKNVMATMESWVYFWSIKETH